MSASLSRRGFLASLALAPTATPARAASGLPLPRTGSSDRISGMMTGANALVEAIRREGTGTVFGIPGAQMNEFWDAMKQQGQSYLLVTHEYSAATMADGYARMTGEPGVCCVVPGPGVTNTLSGVGEALLDSIPMVCLVGDVTGGEDGPAFQVHSLPQRELLEPVTKAVLSAEGTGAIADRVRDAYAIAQSGEPGPVAVIIESQMLAETARFDSSPLASTPVPFDAAAVEHAVNLLCNRRNRIGLHVGLGCMGRTASLVEVAEMLQAPVSTSISGKGAFPEDHPLSVGWGYGGQGTVTAERAFRQVDTVLAIGVKYSEVSTGHYDIPRHRHVIQVDVNPANLGKVVSCAHRVHADSGAFLASLLDHRDRLARPCDTKLTSRIARWNGIDRREYARCYRHCSVDPMSVVQALDDNLPENAALYVDVTLSQHWASEAYRARGPRSYFNPSNNQSMGWSIPAAIGGAAADPSRPVATLTGDGCFLMSAMEISTAVRAGLAVKFFVLDDQGYRYMQALQEPAFRRTTATVLADLDFASLAAGWGIGYQEVETDAEAGPAVRNAIASDGPMLTRVVTDYGERPMRWLQSVRRQYVDELSNAQKVRMLGRIGLRSLDLSPEND